ncbi:MAG: hypothetical protein V4436_03815 [Patescibacteria group bacterium]
MEDILIRRVKVDRSRTLQEMLNALNCTSYVNESVVETIPQGIGDEVEVYFLRVSRFLNNVKVERLYKKHSLKAADVYSLAAVNEADPTFARTYFNGTVWKVSKNIWGSIAFRSNAEDGLKVFVDYGKGWYENWFLAGLRD